MKKKMYKAKKRWVVAGVAVASLLVGATSQASAEEVVTEATATPVAASETASQEPSEIEQAQTAVATAQEDVTEAQNQVASATEEVVVAQANVDQQAQTTNQAEQEVATATSEQKTAEQNLTQAQADNQVAQTTVKAAEAKVSSAQDAVTQSEADVAAAQEAVNAAQSPSSEEEKAKAQDAVTKAEEALKAAEAAKADVENTDGPKYYPVDNVSFKLSDRYINALKTRSEYIERRNSGKYDHTGDVPHEFTPEESRLDHGADKWVELSKIDPKNPDAANKANLSELESAINELKSSLSYDGSQDTRPVDLANLTNDQRMEINFFSQNIINQIRKSFGSREVRTTQSMYDFAQDVSKNIVLNPETALPEGGRREDSTRDKYVEGYAYELINEMAAKYGMRTKGNNSQRDQFQDTLALLSKEGISTTEPYTMGQLKEKVYEGFKTLMFTPVFTADSGRAYERAADVAGTLFYKSTTDMNATSLSVQINPELPNKDKYTVLLHTFFEEYRAEGVPGNFDWSPERDKKITDANGKWLGGDGNGTTEEWEANKFPLPKNQQKFDTTPLVNGEAPDEVELALATQKVNDAKKALEDAKATLATLNADDVESLLEQAKAKLADNQKALEQSQADLTEAQKQVTTSAEKVTEAQDLLDQARTNLLVKNEVLTTEQAKLNDLIKILDEKKLALDTLNEDLEAKKLVYDKAVLELWMLQNPKNEFSVGTSTTVEYPKYEFSVGTSTTVEYPTYELPADVKPIVVPVDETVTDDKSGEMPEVTEVIADKAGEMPKVTNEVFVPEQTLATTIKDSVKTEDKITHLSTVNPKDYQALVAKVEQAMAAPAKHVAPVVGQSVMQTLPETGDATSLMAVLGAGLVTLAGGLSYKRKED